MHADFTLLDVLAYASGCNFLSDLKFTGIVEKLRIYRKLQDLNPDGFTLREWNDTVHYLTNEEVEFESNAAAQSFLVDYYGAQVV